MLGIHLVNAPGWRDQPRQGSSDPPGLTQLPGGLVVSSAHFDFVLDRLPCHLPQLLPLDAVRLEVCRCLSSQSLSCQGNIRGEGSWCCPAKLLSSGTAASDGTHSSRTPGIALPVTHSRRTSTAAPPFHLDRPGFSPADTGVLMHKPAPNACFPVTGTLVGRAPRWNPGTGHVWTPRLWVLRRWPGDCSHVPPRPLCLWT